MTRNPFQSAVWPANLYRDGELAATLDYSAPPLDLAATFGREAPLLLEIGPGHGHYFLQTAAERPDWNLLGIEISRKRSQKISARARRAGLKNVLVLQAVAEMALESLVPRQCAREIHIHFPDPWPKKRHHKRRLLGAELGPRLAEVLQPGALLCVMTDHDDYAAEALSVLDGLASLRNLAGTGNFSARPEEPQTFFQAEALAQGRKIHYIQMQRST